MIVLDLNLKVRCSFAIVRTGVRETRAQSDASPLQNVSVHSETRKGGTLESKMFTRAHGTSDVHARTRGDLDSHNGLMLRAGPETVEQECGANLAVSYVHGLHTVADR